MGLLDPGRILSSDRIFYYDDPYDIFFIDYYNETIILKHKGINKLTFPDVLFSFSDITGIDIKKEKLGFDFVFYINNLLYTRGSGRAIQFGSVYDELISDIEESINKICEKYPEIHIGGNYTNGVETPDDNYNLKNSKKVKYKKELYSESIEHFDINAFLPEVEEEKEEQINKEYIKKCNVCGHIFCYTDQDIKENATNALASGLSAVGAIANILGGNSYQAYESTKVSDRNSSKVKDFDRCPKCNSTNVVLVDGEELMKKEDNSTSTNQPAQPQVSVVDELKQLKELLDIGIITQEEFDAKKKQLLGL